MDNELKTYLQEMERRLREYIDERADATERGLREYIDERTQGLREYIDERAVATERRLSEHIDERTHDAETRIVRAFGAYQESSGVRMRKIEADLSNVNASTSSQIDTFQSKLLELETRIIALEGRK